MAKNAFGYVDIVGKWKNEETGGFYPIKPINCEFLNELTIIGARGVPAPSKDKVNRQRDIYSRELRVCLVNAMNVPVSNTLIMRAGWNAGREDEWITENTVKNQNLILLKDASMSRSNKNHYKAKRLVIELVMTIMINGKTFYMSCGCGQINLAELNQTADKDIQLLRGNLQTGVEMPAGDGPNSKVSNRAAAVIKIRNRIIGKSTRSDIKLSDKCTQLPKTILSNPTPQSP